MGHDRALRILISYLNTNPVVNENWLKKLNWAGGGLRFVHQ